MFLLEELPDLETMTRFSKRYPEMEIDSTAACLRLLKVASILTVELERYFSKYDLSLARFLSLIVLEREPKKSLLPVEIAKKMGTSKKNTLRLLSYMEENKLITRVGHKTDGRASVITITPKGTKLLSSVMPGYYRIINKAMGPLGKESKKILIKILDQVSLDFSE